MKTAELLDTSLTDMAELVATQKVSPVDLVDACLAQIDAVKETNAYISVAADDARSLIDSSAPVTDVRIESV